MEVDRLTKRILGKTGLEVSIIGLGGNRLFRKSEAHQEISRVITHAIESGINFFDTARLYPHSEDNYGKYLRQLRQNIIISTKTDARNALVSRRQLKESLRALKTDYIDIWHLHDVREENEVKAIFGPQGAIEALIWAKREGYVRYLGITAHRDPQIMRMAIEQFPFDVVMIPVNPAEIFYRSFITKIIPAALKRNMGIVAMYIYCGGKIKNIIADSETVEPWQRFALSQKVSTALVGIDNLKQLKENIDHALHFSPIGGEAPQILGRLGEKDYKDLLYYKFN